jgi:hypothetical protein
MTGGQPPRGTELIGLQHSNTAQGQHRGIFIEEGLISTVTSYHKAVIGMVWSEGTDQTRPGAYIRTGPTNKTAKNEAEEKKEVEEMYFTTNCQALGYSGPVRAVMPSNRSILAYLTAVVARQRFVSSLTRQYTSTYTIAVHLVSMKTLLLDIRTALPTIPTCTRFCNNEL